MALNHKRLIAAALGGVLAVSFQPTRSQAEQPKKNDVTGQKENTKQKEKAAGARSDDGSGNQQASLPDGHPPVLTGVVSVITIAPADPILPSGAEYETEVESADEFRGTLASVTGAILGFDGELNDVVDHFVDADRDRLDKQPLRMADLGDKDQVAALQNGVERFKKAWTQKFGEEFEIKENKVYAPLSFAEGEITNASQFIQMWPVRQLGQSRQASPRPSGELSEYTREQANIEAGREFGVALFPAEAGLKPTTVSFIDEAGGWKIDMPDGITTAQLRNNLVNELRYLSTHVRELPSDKNAAYRIVSHRVVNALMGISAKPQS